ncbi:hypothetical protein [Streptomyces sp. NPDC014622]|uniref:hypothetical protein n=1 Tax=Streptomyces sp. NPDC014622 TaxID=3364874 RepID=UPI003701A98D
MSLTNRFVVDTGELGEMAGNAAWLDTSTERLRALTAVFAECGERANVYADPMFVARTLVKEAASAFRFQRMEARMEMVMLGV